MKKIIGNDYIYNNRKVRLVAIEDPRVVYWIYDAGRYDWLHIANIAKLHVVDTPQDKKETVTLSPIYTQEMVDNGELPLVGMECLASVSVDIWFKYRPDYIGKNYTVGFWFDKNREAAFGLECVTFKPITPPIELDDGKAYQFECEFLDDGDARQGIYRKMNNKFYNYNGDFGVEYCTNIQPLTVEVK